MKSIHPQPFVDKISLKTSNGIEMLHFSDIIYCYVESREVKVLLLDGKVIRVFHSLTELEALLVPFHFYRCHAKNLVNLVHIRLYNHKTGYLVVSNNMEIKVAFDRKIKFKQLINSTIPPPPLIEIIV